MGPIKSNKKEVQKQDVGTKIEDPINLDSWKCVVVMAVEKTYYDSFVIKEFIEESSSGRRQEVSLIDLDTSIMKILNDIENGELPYKYSFLLNFSSVFQEAISYSSKKLDIPAPVLVKVVKALLFYLREESFIKIKKAEAGLPDPIKVMAERPANFGTIDSKNKETTKKGDVGLKVKPPSVTKQDTELLKRGERAKDDQRIDDAPTNAYFSLYVLLTGFYNPEFPLELIKAGIPLHGLLCIDTSFSGLKRDASSTRYKFQKQSFETKSQEIQNFWKAFLKILWDPKTQFYFMDIVFQVYVPQKLLCEKKKLGEFIYRELSYLMYDLSDLKRRLNNYLDRMALWSVSEKDFDMSEILLRFENISEECVTVPTVLQFIIDAICKKEKKNEINSSRESSDSRLVDSRGGESRKTESEKCVKAETCIREIDWSQELEKRNNFSLLNVYFKIKNLDGKYDLEDKSFYCNNSEKALNEIGNSQITCNFQPSECGQNMEEALLSSGGIFRYYWKKYPKEVNPIFVFDYCLYSLLMTKIICPYQLITDTSQISSINSYHSYKKNSTFEIIENLSKEMRKPHFTVTEGSRSILKSFPHNIKNTSRDFFCPEQFKIVSPEKLKSSSAPEFLMTPNLHVQTLFKSDVFPIERKEVPTTTFEIVRGFIDECLFSNTNDFSLLELLSKSKLLEKEYEHWSNYNCIDHSYSILNDCIFLMLHNRKDKQNIHHETFNAILRTPVGLRDFYEYIMEDDAQWLQNQEQMYQTTVFLANKILENNSLRSFTSSEFWLVDSIKYQHFKRKVRELREVKTEDSKTEKITGKRKFDLMNGFSLTSDVLEGYDVTHSAVQYSGLKTVYFAKDCSVTVQLIERLYGNQELGIHVNAASNILHLYSYTCPEPHILDPFTFHFTFKNGIIVAFGRRWIETFEEVEEIIESRTPVKGKKNSSEVSTRIVKKLIPKAVRDEDFIYDMVASFPNGLCIRTVRKVLKPCYIKQHYRVNRNDLTGLETSRLFLPNGNVVKIMKDGTVQILKVNASIVTAHLSDLVRETDTQNLKFERFGFISGEGYSCTFEHERLTSSERFQIFKNTDVDKGDVFFRRRDGTNYLLQNDGTLSVQFKDGTKMSSSILIASDSIETSLIGEYDSSEEKKTFGELDYETDFVFVYLKIIAEHPDYATVVYDTQLQKWSIVFPYDSVITVKPNGHYTVDIDKQTELGVETDFIQVNKFGCDRQPQSTFTADLSIFENNEGGIYCHLEDSTGKIFIVEGNSNCYILNDEETSQKYESQEEFALEVKPKESDVSEFVASADLQICPPIKTDKSNKLSRDNKYFVIKRDMTGAELLHVDNVKQELTRTEKGSLVFTQDIPNSEKRCFILISPRQMRKVKKWAVDTVIPNPKYEPGVKKKTISSTYGVPPSWMHPFPKRKVKFVVPRPLTCRVFIETTKTNLSPPVGALDYYNCDIEEINEVKYSRIPPDGVEDYLKKLSNDDQDILKEMYVLAAASLINEKKRLKPINSEKLEHYLEMSKHFVDLREYHKKCIRYHIVPNYFHHPVGISFLILNELVNKLNLPFKTTKRRLTRRKIAGREITSRSSSEFSYEEIEYNLSVSAGQSFSDLSCRSTLSAQTAPAVLLTKDICRCKVKATKEVASSPTVKCYWTEQTLGETSFSESHSRICDFQDEDIETIKKTESEGKETAPMTLEDLMYLGLI